MSNLPEIWVVVGRDGNLHTGEHWGHTGRRVRAGTTEAEARRIRGQVGGRIVRYVPAEDQ